MPAAAALPPAPAVERSRRREDARETKERTERKRCAGRRK
jgi:hypothetical protein